jgi:hypothetical protein
MDSGKSTMDWGGVYDQVNVINREEMLESLYPNETFVGALSSPKQKGIP